MTPKRHSAEERRLFAAVASLEYCVLCGAYDRLQVGGVL